MARDLFHVRRGVWTAYMMDDIAKAIAQTEAGLSCYPGDSFLLICKGLLKRKVGRTAVHRAEKVNELMVTAYDEIKSNRLDSAIATVGQALTMVTSTRDAGYLCRLRGHVMRRLGRYGDAYQDLSLAVIMDPLCARSWTDRCSVLINLGWYKAAEADSTRALALDADHGARAIAHCNRGFARMMLGQLGKALADLNEALRMNPSSSSARCIRGEIKRLRGWYESALDDIEISLEIDRGNARAICARGCVLHSMGRLDAALRDYNESARLSGGKCDMTLWSRANLMLETGHTKEAYDDLSALIRLLPSNAFFRACRADVLRMMDKHAEALAELDVAVELDEFNAFACRLRAEVKMASMGPEGWRSALKDAERAVSIAPNVRSMCVLAELRRRLGILVGALDCAEQVLSHDPDNADALRIRAFVLVKQGRPWEAMESAKKALEIQPSSKMASLILDLAQKSSSRKRQAPTCCFGDAGKRRKMVFFV